MTYDLEEICRAFPLAGKFAGAEPYGNGHIHDTFLMRRDDGGRESNWIVQRINHVVFQDPPAVMDNIAQVSAHVREKLVREGSPDPNRECLTFIRARDGKHYSRDARGNYWRICVFVAGASSLSDCRTSALALEAARAFGRFQRLLADFPASRLAETIPHFHDTRRRLNALKAALKADAAGRAKGAAPEIEFALARENIAGTVASGLESGDLPTRVTHNDTKLNNVLIDDRTGKGVCVIDLDTVMPGSALYDIGDMVRTTAATAQEDETDLSKVDVDDRRFEAIMRGYAETIGPFLTAREKELLPFSGLLLCYTIGLRFLTDHLAGDLYFKTHRPGHNLDRARTQFAMVSRIEAKSDRLAGIVRGVFSPI